uniref:Cytochrome c oxidase subunit 2 n=1 Tax=Xya japonica TaxID=1661859 RepID=A0A7L9QDM0_9ORTH|nr:cytochrome c oxidase subunit II [Xya japonica]
MATWSMINLQDMASPIMEQLMFFHDHSLMILLMITILVGYTLLTRFFNKFNNRFLLNQQMIEIIWTVTPAVILIFIALPSLQILYLLDEALNPNISIKSIGHQWYWSYEYSDFKSIEFDSYMKPSNDLNLNEFRLLDVDNRLVLPLNSQIRMLTAAADVLHSWTIPSLGVKADASPGWLNQINFIMIRPGLFYGQCSEICGANQTSFMPIVIESVSPPAFIKWIMSQS